MDNLSELELFKSESRKGIKSLKLKKAENPDLICN